MGAGSGGIKVEEEEKGGRDNPALQLDDDVAERGAAAATSARSYGAVEDAGRDGMKQQQEAEVEAEAAAGAQAKKDAALPEDQIDSDRFFEELHFEPNWVSRVEDAAGGCWRWAAENALDRVGGPVVVSKVAVFILYNCFFFKAVHHYDTDDDPERDMDWCNGMGFLIIMTLLVYWGLLYFLLVKPGVKRYFESAGGAKNLAALLRIWDKIMSHPATVYVIYAVGIMCIVVFLIVDTADDRNRLVSAFGLVVLVLFGWVFSSHPSKVVWRHVAWGLVLQFIFGLIILRWSVGRAIFECLGNKVSTFLDYSLDGSSFVFGYLASPGRRPPFATYKMDSNTTEYAVASAINSSEAFNWVFMFRILSVIYFFSFFISMLFYLGWMQWLVIKIGWILQVTLGTTACESLNAAANIFLGQSEAPLMIKPYLPLMTPSELHAVMTGGFATIAGSVLAAYISFGVSASHLLSASVMSAPAALAFAKLMMPETKKTKTLPKDIKIEKGNAANILDAASEGAIVAVFLVANIGATLVAVLAFIAFLNGVVAWMGGLAGVQGLSIEWILGKIFVPLAWLMGVPSKDLEEVGTLIGLKSFINEFAAYDQLARFYDKGEIGERAKVIATYALCGFANPASVGIQIAALSTMAPGRRADLARVAGRAFVAGSLACFCTACIAGTLIGEES